MNDNNYGMDKLSDGANDINGSDGNLKGNKAS